jgi:hypothetical protein
MKVTKRGGYIMIYDLEVIARELGIELNVNFDSDLIKKNQADDANEPEQ